MVKTFTMQNFVLRGDDSSCLLLAHKKEKPFRSLPRFSVLNSPRNLPTLQTPKLGKVSNLRVLLLGLPRFVSALNDLSYKMMRN